MSHVAESGCGNYPHVCLPVLLECDWQGKVVRLNDRARATMGEARSLTEMMAPSAASSAGVRAGSWRMRFLFESGGNIVVGAQPAEALDAAAWCGAAALMRLESRFVGHYFHLQRAERGIAARLARTRPRPAGGQLARSLEAERQRLGRELHTGVGQLLAAITLQLETALTRMPEMPPPAAQALDRIGKLAEDALEQVRAISQRVHPPPWQRMTLAEALRQMWETSGVPERFDGVLRVAGLEREPEPEIKALLYRAAQEALSNVARHAPQATAVHMGLESTGDTLRLIVRDNGPGFDVAARQAAPAAISSGLGLRSLSEEAAAVGGVMTIESGPQGTVMTVATAWAPSDAPE